LGVTTDQLLIGFFVSLTLVVVFLVGAIVLAKLHKVKGHLAGIGAMLVALVATLVFAETLGRRYTFDPLSYRVHMPIAFLAAGALFAPLITGYRHWKGKGSLGAHKKAFGVWFTLVVLALGTGGWMLSAATRKADAAEADTRGE